MAREFRGLPPNSREAMNQPDPKSAVVRTSSRTALACLLWLLNAFIANAADRKPGEVLPPGDVRSERGFYSLVFYYTPKPAAETLPIAQALAKRLLPSVSVTTAATNSVQPPFIGFQEEQSPLKDFPIPDAKYF